MTRQHDQGPGLPGFRSWTVAPVPPSSGGAQELQAVLRALVAMEVARQMVAPTTKARAPAPLRTVQWGGPIRRRYRRRWFSPLERVLLIVALCGMAFAFMSQGRH